MIGVVIIHIRKGVTKHVCSNKGTFFNFKEVDSGESLSMGNSASFEVKAKGNVILKMTFRKEHDLKKLLYVSDIWKKLIFVSLLKNMVFNLCLNQISLYSQ